MYCLPQGERRKRITNHLWTGYMTGPCRLRFSIFHWQSAAFPILDEVIRREHVWYLQPQLADTTRRVSILKMLVQCNCAVPVLSYFSSRGRLLTYIPPGDLGGKNARLEPTVLLNLFLQKQVSFVIYCDFGSQFKLVQYDRVFPVPIINIEAHFGKHY